MRTFLGALVAVLLSLGSSAAEAALEKPDLVLAVGGKTTLYYLPLTVAERLGYCKDEGLNLEIHDFPGGAHEGREARQQEVRAAIA
jgi:NitT/TauT family transport system substrate-binding protein